MSRREYYLILILLLLALLVLPGPARWPWTRG
jgi:hypothetical protein